MDKEVATLIGSIALAVLLLISIICVGDYATKEQAHRHRMEALSKGCTVLDNNIYCEGAR